MNIPEPGEPEGKYPLHIMLLPSQINDWDLVCALKSNYRHIVFMKLKPMPPQ